MASKAEKKHQQAAQTPGVNVHHHRFLTPEENAELIDAIQYDDSPTAAEYDLEYNG
jgi:hypothetical protein